MSITVRKFNEADIMSAVNIWNEVVREGNAFPQIEELNRESGMDFFLGQSYTGVAVDENGAITGLYILHPNNIGRCGHICNASYAVSGSERGKHIGELLVRDCIITAKKIGFKILQFNAVVSTNTPALKLYEKLGFKRLGTIPGGFLKNDGSYADIIPHYYLL